MKTVSSFYLNQLDTVQNLMLQADIQFEIGSIDGHEDGFNLLVSSKNLQVARQICIERFASSET